MNARLIHTDQFDDQIIIPTLGQQMCLSGFEEPSADTAAGTYFNAPTIDLDIYDRIIVSMSGKDSIGCLLALIEQGVDMSRIEFWHCRVDGNEGSQLFDWICNDDFMVKLAEAFNVPLYFSWLAGGLEGEMLKENAFSAPHMVETPEGLITLERDTSRMQPSTRRRFPQQSASLSTRWCSSAAKIDVARRAITNQDRFLHSKTLFVTGERRQESKNRAGYYQLEPHSVDRRHGRLGRHVDAWRPVLHYSEEALWGLIERFRIEAPVPYKLGWSRSSCLTCVYSSAKVWSTIKRYFPRRIKPIADYETEFGCTISRKLINVVDLAATAEAFQIEDMEALAQAERREYTLPIFTPEGETWKLPAGAFSNESCGSV